MKKSTKEAVLHVLSQRSGPSKYGLAKTLGVRPIMVDHYLKGSRMKQVRAEIFMRVFGIEITDIYDPTADALTRYKDVNSKEVSGRGE